MNKQFDVTFYKQWLSMLLVPTLGLPVALGALSASKLWANGTGFLLYVGILVGGGWLSFWLIKKWALLPCEVSISETALTIKNLAADEMQQVLFAEIEAYRLDDGRQLVLHLHNGRKIQYQVNQKFYNPGSFVEMCRALEQALHAATSRAPTRLG